MSFNSADTAIVSEPVELLFFAQDESYWAYAIGDEDVTRDTILYRAGLVTRSAFQVGDELNQVSVKVQISTETDLGALLQTYNGVGTKGDLFMRVILAHANDTSTVTPFFGHAIEFARHGSYVEVTFDSSMSVMKRKILRFSGGTQCNHALYDSGCGIDREDFRIDATVLSVTGRLAAAGSGADPDNTLQTLDYYAGGLLVYGREEYFIEHNDIVGNLTMETQLPSYIVGQPVILYAGCDRSYDTCQQRFDNVRNFGGFPNFPVVSYFGSSSAPRGGQG